MLREGIYSKCGIVNALRKEREGNLSPLMHQGGLRFFPPFGLTLTPARSIPAAAGQCLSQD